MLVFATSPVLTTPNLGTPSAAVLSNAIGLSLTTGVVGVLPIANGGTNSSVALNSNRIMTSIGGAIVELSAMTANKVSFYSATGLPTFNTNIEVDNINTRMYIGGVTPTDILQLGASTTSHASLRLTAGVAPTSANDGAMWNDSVQKAFFVKVAGVNQAVGTTLYTQINTGIVGNTTTETTIINTAGATGTTTIPINFLTLDKTLRITAFGTFTRAAGNVTLRFKVGGVTFAATATTNPSNATNGVFTLDVIMTCRSTGALGAVFTQGIFRNVDGNTSFSMPNTTTNSIDTTVANVMDLTYQNSALNAANNVACTNVTIQVLN